MAFMGLGFVVGVNIRKFLERKWNWMSCIQRSILDCASIVFKEEVAQPLDIFFIFSLHK